MPSWRLLSALFVSLGSLHRLTGVLAKDEEEKQPSFLQQSFFFDWPTTGVPSQIVEQCDTLAISWSRGSAQGPNPVAPYVLQIYTSAFVVPLIIDAGSGSSFDFPVPFNPGTQFQICMFDKAGNPGGCQRPMSVYPSLQSNPTCRNLTYPRPEQVLDIAGTDWTGSTLSQFGWPPQCKDISLQPKNGTPPYTLTVAPSLHPPWNITSDGKSPLNWTVALSWGSMFYISVSDSAGNLWANGPMHAGGDGPTGCLADTPPPPNNEKSNQVSTYVAIGTGIGGLVAGLVIGLVGVFVTLRCFKRHRQGGLLRRDSIDSVPSLGTIAPYTAVPQAPYHDRTDSTLQTPHGVGSLGHLRTDKSYKLEPFVPPQQHQPPTPSVTGRESLSGAPGSDGSTTGPQSPGSDQRQSRPGHVYVVHHDGGRAPVTVYTSDGTEVVELPPVYNQESQAGSSSSGSRLEPQRRVPSAVRKPEARMENETNTIGPS